MIRLVLFLAGVAAAAAGLAWLADRPGNLMLTWQGYEVETSVFRAVVILATLIGLGSLAWSIIRQIWLSPAVVGHFLARRRQERGLDALSSGMIAVGAGDRSLATRYAMQARRALPNEPLTHLLRAQAAQLSGDRTTSRRIFEAMLSAPDTEQLGLRGLFLEAERTGEPAAARQFAERALQLNAKLGWPVDALFELQCMAADWEGALKTLASGRKHGHVERSVADRKRAVLLTAQAQDLEDSAADTALTLAQEAHTLAPDLVPAAAIAGRALASRGNTPKAARVLEKTWKRAPHPDLAVAYAYARPGDSPRDRLERVKRLARLAPHSVEGPIAVANTAIEARDWEAARKALEPLLETRLSQRVCTLMARIEGEQRNDAGRVREWLARAVNAPRDPVWTADGVVSDRWEAISPTTGALDAFQWRVPVESIDMQSQELIAAKLEELVELGARREVALETKPISPDAAASLGVRGSNDIEPTTEEMRTAGTRLDEAATGAVTIKSIASDEKQPAAEVVPVAPKAAKEDPPATARVQFSAKAPSPSPSTKKVLPEARANLDVADPNAPAARPVRGKQAEPRIFVPPHAPDDPGPDDSPESVALSYRSPAAKRPL
ncbi:MAG: heme biosynthesis HemY N-terminal domain-containing protein [Hyphomicrobiaceae bacterium]|jgi:HemY protein